MPTPADLLAACQRRRDWLVATIEDLVRLESPSDDRVALSGAASAIAAHATALGWTTRLVEQAAAGPHVRAEIGDGEPQVLLLGHYDTVWPVGQLARMPLRHEEGRLHGPGVYDMKSGIAIGWLALQAIAECRGALPFRTVMLLTSDEEVGSATSRALLEDEAVRSRAVLVLEPSMPDGGVKTARKGVGEYRVEAHGRSAHAGIEPQKGASAIAELCRVVRALGDLQDLQRGITVNVGRIAGGTRSNVVAEFASAEVDVRIPTHADAARVDGALRALASETEGVTLRVTGGMNRPPLERTSGVLDLYARAKDVAASLGFELAEGATGGGSDGNFTAARGVPTLDGLGPMGAGAHALDEHVRLEPLAGRAALIAGLLLRLT
jgi:glutamate carboxypeptidase